MQNITPVDVHIENDWRDNRPHNSYVKKPMNSTTRNGRTNPRMRTCVATKSKTTRPKSATLPQQTVQVKPVPLARSRTPSPNRDPWLVKRMNYFTFEFDYFRIPPPARTTKGQRFAWQVENVVP